MGTYEIKKSIEKAITTWNSHPEVEQWLSLEEQSWSIGGEVQIAPVPKPDDITYSFRVIINIQQVIYQNGGQALVNIKTPMFMNEWRGTTTLEKARERSYEELFDNLLLHGFTSGVKSLEFIRKHKVQTY